MRANEKWRAEGVAAAAAQFKEEVTILDAAALKRSPWAQLRGLDDLIDGLGRASAAAQGLKAAVTTLSHLRAGDQRLYVYTTVEPDGSRAPIGLLKVGPKTLYHWDATGNHRCLPNQLCVLDFYVAERAQRQGVGARLFAAFLAAESATAAAVAYDRPSPKLLAFLRKHYGLAQYTPQRNNYVIYEDFFGGAKCGAKNGDALARRPLTSRGVH